MSAVKKWIVDANIECMLIDYQLKAEYDFVGTEFDEFCEMLKQSTQVFKTNKNKYISKYTELYKKKTEGNILPEEEDLLTVFKIIKAYGEVDDLLVQLQNILFATKE